MGLLNILAGKEKITDRGHILENIVYLELLRRSNKIWTGTIRNLEVDFVCKTPTVNIKYYQIAWQLTNDSNVEREFGAIEKSTTTPPNIYLTQIRLPKTETE